MHSIDRGGLCKITDEAHTFFYEVELFVKRFLNAQGINDMDDQFKRTVLHAMKDDARLEKNY